MNKITYKTTALASEQFDLHALLKDEARDMYRYAGYRAGMHEVAHKGVNPPGQTRRNQTN